MEVEVFPSLPPTSRMYEEEEDLPQLSTEERIRLVSDFIRQAPPGEVNDVINGPSILNPPFQISHHTHVDDDAFQMLD